MVFLLKVKMFYLCYLKSGIKTFVVLIQGGAKVDLQLFVWRIIQ